MKKSETNKRQLNRIINVRMSQTLYDSIHLEAERRGISGISLCRGILVSQVPDADPLDVQPRRRPTEPYAPPPEIVHDLRACREAAAEATGSAIMLAKLAREESLSIHHDDLERIIPRLRSSAFQFLELADTITRHHREASS